MTADCLLPQTFLCFNLSDCTTLLSSVAVHARLFCYQDLIMHTRTLCYFHDGVPVRHHVNFLLPVGFASRPFVYQVRLAVVRSVANLMSCFVCGSHRPV